MRLVEEGDIIKINIPENKLELAVSDEAACKKEKAEWKPRKPKVTTGYLARYAALVTSGNRGAVSRNPQDKEKERRQDEAIRQEQKS